MLYNILCATGNAEWYHYALMVFIAFIAAVKVIFQNDFSRNFGKNFADMSLYLSFVFFFIAIITFAMAWGDQTPSWETIVLGVSFGLVATFTQIIYTFAMKNGPVGLTVLIINFNMIIPIMVGMIFWQETISPAQWIGMALLSVAMVLILYQKPVKRLDRITEDAVAKKKRYTIWIICTALAYLLFAVNAVIQVWHQHIPHVKAEFDWFVCISYFVAGVCSLLVIPASRQKITFKFNWRIIADIVFAAIALGLYNYIKPLLNAYVENNVLQPVTSILNIVFATLFGVILFKDKITIPQWLGFAIGLGATLLLCL